MKNSKISRCRLAAVFSLFWLLASVTMSAQPVSDNNPQSEVLSNSATGTISNFWVPANDDRLLVVYAVNSSDQPSPTVTFGSSTMNVGPSQSQGGLVVTMYYLVLGSGAATTENITATGSNLRYLAATSFHNVDQSDPTDGEDDTFIEETATSSTLPVNSNPLGLVIDAFGYFAPSGATDITEGAGQTLLFKRADSSPLIRFAASIKAGTTPSVDMNWTVVGTPTFGSGSHVGMNLRGVVPCPVTGSIWYVDAAAASGGTGTSWACAFQNLQDAINAASSGHEIWVKAGTYLPTKDPFGNASPTDPRDKTFYLKSGVKIYGGFDGLETMLSERDWVANPTILSGDLGTSGPENSGDNAYHVVVTVSDANTTILDGFTVEKGNANGTGSITVESLNVARNFGGGMFNYSSATNVSNCTLSGNSTSNQGGGVYNFSSSSIFSNCTFSGNSSVRGGGMFNAGGATVAVTECIFSGNSASSEGGGIYNGGSSPATVTNCLFSGNKAVFGGGMYINNGTSSPVMTNCTFSGNTADTAGGGIYNASFTTLPTLTNCIIWNNRANSLTGSAAANLSNASASPVITYSLIQNWNPSGMGNINGIANAANSNFPSFVTPLDPATAPSTAGDFHISSNCSLAIDAGTNTGAPATDLFGNARPFGVNVDLGVHEFQGTAACSPQGSVWYVDAAGSVCNTGTSWACAFQNLQDAINIASSGHEIWVKAGTYLPTKDPFGNASPTDPRDKTFYLKNGVKIYGGFDGSETMLSERDWVANVTILSGDFNGDDAGFTNNTENAYHVAITVSDANTTQLDGFTLKSGNANGGAGSFITVEGNPIVRGYGGGLHNYAAATLVQNCTFTYNSSTLNGGAMFSNSAAGSQTTNCLFTSNAANNGGGVFNTQSSPIFTNCTFSSNTATSSGGGMRNESSTAVVLTGCVFTGNSCGSSNGGGFYIGTSSTSASLTNCLLTGNSAGSSGGGLYNSVAAMTLTNCTVSGNKASGSGGGVTFLTTNPTVTNCLIWNNRVGSTTGSATANLFTSSSTPVITYSLIQNNNPSGTGNINGIPSAANSNFPGFVTPLDPATAPSTAGDFHIGSNCSLAIDAGTNTGAPATDLFGNARPFGVNVDLGVHEFQGTAACSSQGSIWYVDAANTGCQVGSSWACAFQNLQDAIAAASSGHEIWVKAGTYLPTLENGGTGDRFKTFFLNKNIKIYGGFDGSETLLSERDWVANPTILSGDLGISGPENSGDNSYHVVTTNGLASTATLDGFTISGGNANGTTIFAYGGGAYNSGSSSLIFANCIFSNNLASTYGGGMYNTASSPTLTNCTFSSNSASQNGGGMYNTTSSPTLTNCTFSSNSTGNSGGGMYNSTSSPTLTNCTFSSNSASSSGGSGGGMSNSTSPSVSLTGCTFSGNSANSTGGGMYIISSPSILTNCIFTSNTTTFASGGGGGGVYVTNSSPTFNACEFIGNTSAYHGGGMFNISNSIPTLTNCRFSGNSANFAGGGVYNGSSPAVLTNCTLSGNRCGNPFGGGGINNNTSNAVLTNCIIWNNRASTTTGSAGANMDSPSSTPVITYSLIQNHNPSGTGNLNGIPSAANSNFPGFVTPLDPATAPSTAGDFHIGNCSPAANFGTSIGAPATDLFGNARPFATTVDMGVHELQTASAVPTAANAGSDQNVSVNSATMAANTPTVGTGAWTLVSGSGTITTPSSPSTTITNLGTGANVFRWTISNAPCTASTDDVQLTYTPPVVLTCPTNTTVGSCQTQSAVNLAFSNWLATASGSGGCDGALTNNNSGAPSACGGSVTVTFTYTSTCEPLTSTCQATFTVATTASPTPVFANCANNTVTLGCNPFNLPSCTAIASGGFGGAVTASNSCGSVPVTCTASTIDISGCTRTQVFTFEATACGQTITCTRTFTWTVVTPPSFNGTCGNQVINLGCNPVTLPSCDPNVTASNECGAITVNCNVGSITENGCNRSQQLTYVANASGCGTFSTCTKIYNWQITTAPVFANCDNTIDLGCNPATLPSCTNAQTSPFGGAVTASNECGSVSVSCAAGTVASNGCNRSQIFTFTATACGFTSTCTRTFTWSVDPTATLTCPTSTTVGAGQTQTAVDATFATWLAGASFSGGCGGVLTNDNTGAPSACGGSTTVTFTLDLTCQTDQTCQRTFTVSTPNNSIWYVDGSAASGGNGTSWACAFQNVQDAIDAASSGHEIWVKAGTYLPTKDPFGNASPSDPRDKTFYMKNGVKIYGGFDGSETMRSERDWVANVTMLSGDIGTSGDNSDNAYHVVVSVKDANTTALDGFTVEKGAANGSGSITVESSPIVRTSGGGLIGANTAMLLSNCQFSSNDGGGGSGGGGCLFYFGSTAALNNCQFLNNTTTGSGAGLLISTSSPTLTDCLFSGNTAGSDGGGVYNINPGANPVLTRCIFLGNTAGASGGGMYNDAGAPLLTNCLFSGNKSNSFGGGMININATANAQLFNCTFSGNHATSHGGGFSNFTGTSTLTNCLIWNNRAGSTTGTASASLNIGSGTVNITYSLIQNHNPSGTGNLNGIPNAANSNFPDFVTPLDPATAPSTGGDFHIGACSPVLDKGDDAANSTTTDLGGQPRKTDNFPGGALIDLGAFEFQGTPTAAVATCQAATVQLDGAGNGTLAASSLNNGSTGCAPLAFSASQTSFNCSNFGVNTVTLTITALNGATATCNATVTVADQVAPNALCRDFVKNLDANGAATITAAEVNNLSNDNCGTVNLVGVSPNSFTCSDLGAKSVTLSINDGHGNTASCNATVTVADNTSPTAICQNVAVNLSGNSATVTAAQVNNGSSDNCGTTNLSLSQTTFTCANVGDNSVVLTVNDGHGNTAICAATVTVVDATNPTAQCQNVSVNLNSSGTASVTAAQVNNGSSDACDIASLALTQTDFDCSDVGANTVTLTVTDNNNRTATCSATVTVNDNTDPTAVCQNATVNLDQNGNGTLVATQVDGGSTDNCGIAMRSVTPNTFTTADIGANTVTLTITDNNNRTATCSATVTVTNTNQPNAVCQPYTAVLGSNGTATISAANVDGGSSAVGGIQSMSVSPNSFTCSDLGANTVTLTVTGNNNLTATCNAVVTVQDNTPPTAVCQNVAVNLSGNTATVTASQILNAALSSDNCGVVTAQSVSPNSFTCSNLGENAVTLTVNDGHGNAATCAATVTVSDATAPTAVCQNLPVSLNSSGTASISAAQVNNGSTDNCGTVNLGGISSNTFTCSDLGANTVTLTINDGHGNAATCIATVTVSDATPPTALCRDVVVQLDGTGNASLMAAQVNNGSTDNCALGTLSVAPNAFTLANLGLNTVTLTVNDANGNASTCAAQVTVENNQLPNAVCQNITRSLGSDGMVALTAADVDGGSTALGGIASRSVLPTNLTCADIGAATVTLTIIGSNGQQSSCNATVTVSDNLAPNPVCQNVAVNLSGNTATVTASQINNGSTDNCGTVNLVGVSPNTFTCSDLGANTVTLTINDGHGNAATCAATVTVQSSEINLRGNNMDISDGDATPSAADHTDFGQTNGPSVVRTFTVQNTDPNVPLGVTGISLGGVDAAQFSVTPLSPAGPIPPNGSATFNVTYAPNATGIHNATVTVTNGDCDEALYDFAIRGELTCVVPTFTACPANLPLVNASSGQCSATVTYSVSADGLPAPTLTYSFAGATVGSGSGTGSGAAFSAGVTTVTVTATNPCSMPTCTFTVTVADVENPSIVRPANVSKTTDSGQCTALITYASPSFSDNCPGVVLTRTAGPASGEVVPKGTRLVEWKATDAGGRTAICQFSVTVTDGQAPSISCPGNIARNTDANQCSAVVTYAAPTASDNCLPAPTTSLLSPVQAVSGWSFPKGTTVVVWKVTDGGGLTTTCSFTVTVNDVQVPSIVCPSNIVSGTDAGQCNASVNYSTPTASDNCTGVAATLQSGLPSGAKFPKGINVVVWKATDASGVTKTCTFRVTVNDTEAPAITCPSSQSVSTTANACSSAPVTYATPTATDNCPGAITVTRLIGPASGSPFGLGVTNVVWRAVDGAGRSSTCSFTVAVTDATVPLIYCPSSVSVAGGGSPCTAVATYPTPTATDNCGVQSVFLLSGQPSGSSFPAGMTSIVWRAVDNGGNSATCSFTINVSCGTAPNSSEGGENVTAERDGATSNFKLSNFKLNLAPNPATTEVLISIENLGEKGGELTVLDAQGRTVWQSNVQRPTFNVPLENLAAGLYFVTLRSDGKSVTKHLVVARQ